jgi:hypothetical protein
MEKQTVSLNYYKARGRIREDAPEQVHLMVRWVMVFGKQSRQYGDTLCARLTAGEPMVPTQDEADCPECLRLSTVIRETTLDYIGDG